MTKRPPEPPTDQSIAVSCAPAGDGWRCVVRVGDDPEATDHEVTLDRATLIRLADGAEPDEMVRESFRFLLEREPRTSIMRSFELPIIGRFFAEYDDEIQRRMVGS